MRRVVLTSSSPFKLEAFSWLRHDFLVQTSNVKEDFEGRPKTADALVRCLAEMKAKNVAQHHPEAIVIGFYSIGYFEDKILEKPKSMKEMANRLKMLSGKFHILLSGVSLVCADEGILETKVSETRARMRYLDESEIAEFVRWDQGSSMCFALGFDPIDGIGASFVDLIYGSYTSYIYGIPLDLVQELLKKYN